MMTERDDDAEWFYGPGCEPTAVVLAVLTWTAVGVVAAVCTWFVLRAWAWALSG
jgi:hypothetical protein